MTLYLLYVLIGISLVGCIASWRRASLHKKSHTTQGLHSQPKYHGYFTFIWGLVPAAIVMILWLAFENTILDGAVQNKIPDSMKGENASLVLNKAKSSTEQTDEEMRELAEFYNQRKALMDTAKFVLVTVISLAGAIFAYRRFKPHFRARNRVEHVIKNVLLLSSFIAVITTIGIVFSLLFESWAFFTFDDGGYKVSISEFFSGTVWSPTGEHPKFGVIPLFIGTLIISSIALFVAVPIGLSSAIYLSEYANAKVRNVAKPLMELLAGIPTVVYGFFAVLTVAPLLKKVGDCVDLRTDPSSALISSESALAAGLVMGIMIIPFISSLADDAISSVPQYLRDGSYGLGGTKSETIKKVVLPAALPGIVGGILLAASRAIGETMIVVMAAGMAASMNVNPLQAVTTITVQIVAALTGDQEFTSPKTLVAFALALLLFFVTLILNLVALRIVKKYREQYD